MFQPRYLITEALLRNIRQIENLITKLRYQPMPPVVRVQMEREARERSSYSSNSIEGNPLSLTDVKRLLKSHPKHLRDTEKEILNYNSALLDLIRRAESKELPISSPTICSLQRLVTKDLLPTSDSGHYRTQPVFVNDPHEGKTIYWPPDAKDVELLMEDLISFIRAHEGDVDPIILAGIFHRQFVLIHPFMDGNGRTARLCTTALLFRGGFDLFRYFSFEQFYNKNVRQYFDHVGALGNYYDIVESINFTAWLTYFTDGIIDELIRVEKQLTRFSGKSVQLKKHHKKILSYLQKHGSITEQEYAEITKRAKSTRIIDFRNLVELGLIERKGRGKATYYVLKEIYTS